MPVITRTTRACALALAGLGLGVTGLGATAAVAPAAHAGEPEAVIMTGAETRAADARAEERRKATAERRRAAARRVNGRISSATAIAMAQRGDPYAYGAAGPSAFDCSGLIHYSYKRAGFAVPRTSGAIAAHTRRIAKPSMRAGDLMFFTGGGGVYHAAIFLRWSHGKALMLHSPGSGQRVQVTTAWTNSWFGGTLR
jgi:cell wall-associated NlpC family hydrolase